MATPWNNVESPVSVSTIAELTGEVFYAEGAPCRVLTLAQTWFSTFTLPSGMTSSLDGSSGAVACQSGFWVNSNVQNGTISQTTWFIDDVAGNTTNSGLTALLPITEAERQRRWGALTVLLKTLVTVTYLTSPTTKVNYDVEYLDSAALKIVGTPTVTNANVALTAVQVLDRTVSPTVRWAITGVGLGAADVARLVNINAGPRIGNYALVLKDEGAGKVDVSPFGAIDITGAGATGASFAQATPQVGDVVDVMTVPTLTIGNFTARSGTNTLFTNAPANCVVFDNVQLDGSGSGTNTIQGTILCLGANLFFGRTLLKHVRVAGWGGFWQCGGGTISLIRYEMVASVNGGSFCLINGTGYAKGAGGSGVATVNRATSADLDGDATFQDFSFFTWGFTNVGRVGMYDRALADLCFQVLLGGAVRNRTFLVGALLYGDNNLGVGVKVFAGASYTYSVKPTINTSNGAGRQSLIGGVNTDWAAVPAVTAANNAMIVLDA